MIPNQFSSIFADYTWTGMIDLGLCSKNSTSDRFHVQIQKEKGKRGKANNQSNLMFTHMVDQCYKYTYLLCHNL